MTIKQLNNLAAKDDLELVKDKGYFYWMGTNVEMNHNLFMLKLQRYTYVILII